MAEFTTYMWSVPDWRTDEMHTDLDNREQGIFRNLIDECWVRGSISSDTESLAKFSQEPHEYFLLAWAKMKGKFSPISGGSRLINPRLEEDRARLMRTDKFTVKRAKKAAKTRWDKVRAAKELHAGSIAQASNKHAIKQCQSHPQLREDSSLIDLPNTDTSPILINRVPEPPPAKAAGARDAAADHFTEKHREFRKTPYLPKQADFVHLAKLRKAYSIGGKETPEGWEAACLNYFASDLKSWTIADLVNRYSVFFGSPVDRYGISTGNGNGGNGNGNGTNWKREGTEQNSRADTPLGRLRKLEYTPKQR